MLRGHLSLTPRGPTRSRAARERKTGGEDEGQQGHGQPERKVRGAGEALGAEGPSRLRPPRTVPIQTSHQQNGNGTGKGPFGVLITLRTWK